MNTGVYMRAVESRTLAADQKSYHNTFRWGHSSDGHNLIQGQNLSRTSTISSRWRVDIFLKSVSGKIAWNIFKTTYLINNFFSYQTIIKWTAMSTLLLLCSPFCFVVFRIFRNGLFVHLMWNLCARPSHFLMYHWKTSVHGTQCLILQWNDVWRSFYIGKVLG